MIKLQTKYVNSFVSEEEIEGLKKEVSLAHRTLHNGTGAGSDFIGWLDWPIAYDRDEYARIREASKRIRENSDILIVIGIGGSYLGARAAIEMLKGSNYNMLSMREGKDPMVLFAGNSISASDLYELIELIDGYDISLNVISKSGTTTEPAIAFRILKEYVEEKYGKEEARKRIYATTDKARGALKTLADQEGYETFVIPDNIGGRYSLLTPVGLLPIAVAGIDTDSMLKGAEDAYYEYLEEDNPCYLYAAYRNALYRKGKTIEIMASYEPSFHYFSEWWKQLYGESEGKDHKGIFPAALSFTTDLHSMGQYIQDGQRNIFETLILTEKSRHSFKISSNEDNLDGLNYIAGMDLDEVNKVAAMGTVFAHTDGGVANIILSVKEASAYNFGALVYFFEKACAISGYLLGVNPFDQEGVEDYKRNMFALLGKEGYEGLGESLKKRIN